MVRRSRSPEAGAALTAVDTGLGATGSDLTDFWADSLSLPERHNAKRMIRSHPNANVGSLCCPRLHHIMVAGWLTRRLRVRFQGFPAPLRDRRSRFVNHECP